MGLTELEEGCVWNTMPAHTHQRRSEVYVYFNLKPDSFVVHILGEANETRHVIIKTNKLCYQQVGLCTRVLELKTIHSSGQWVVKIRCLMIWIGYQ